MANRSAPPGGLYAHVLYPDVPAAADWLCRAFGFQIRLVAGGTHAQLLVGPGAGIILGEDVDELPTHAALFLTVRVDDVDAHRERAVAAGAVETMPPTTFPFGERQWSATDPWGHRWAFTQTVEDAVPDSWGARLP